MNIIILGAGIAGLATALSLTHFMHPAPSIRVLELRPSPSSIGGAIGLTPNALRALNSLGVLDVIRKHGFGAGVDGIEIFDIQTGGRCGGIDFSSTDGKGIGTPPFRGLRILRGDLLKALGEVVAGLKNVTVEYGKKVVEIREEAKEVVLGLEGDEEMRCDLLVGCDGIHSKVRQVLVEPDRQPVYTGIAAVSGFATLDGGKFHWKDTGLVQGQRGSMVASMYTAERDEHYIGAVMETEDVKSRAGWLAKGAEQEGIKQSVLERYQSDAMPYLRELIMGSHTWNLYPVYKLGPRGKWCTKRAILLGDAAHAMPPQGESAGIALEDAIVFGRVMGKIDEKGLERRSEVYERIRRKTVDEAYQQATFGWETNKDCSWLRHKVRGWLTLVFLWWTSDSRAKRYAEDLATMELDLD
jgi:salicylate hydroxylase